MGFESESTDASCDDLDSMYTISESGSSKTDRSYKCPIDGCGKGFNKPKRLEVHVALHNGERPYKCTHEGCDKAYGVSQHLNRHIKNKHGPKSMYKKILRCPHPDCSLELSNQHNLKRHYYRKHKNKSPFTCTYCDLGFSKHSQLKRHLYIHTGIPPYRCPKCDIGFTSLTDYNRHQRGHKEYVCSECDEVLSSWSRYRTHLKLKHPSEFVCDTCGRSFKGKSRLKIHVSIHQEPSERDIFSCPYPNCPRFYFQKRNLTHHIKSSHEGKRFDCTYADCNREFCNKQKLEEHLKLHRTNRPPRRKKKPSKRCDTGIPKRSMAVKLSGIKVPYETEKRILNNYLNTPKKCSSFAEINPRNIFEECVMRDCISTDTRNKKLCETVTSEMVSEKPCETSGHIIESDNECERTKSKLTDVKNTKISDITAQCHVKKSSEEKENVKYKYISSGIININSDTMLPNSPLEKLTDTVVEFCNEEHFSNSVCDEISDIVHNFKILNCSNTLESEINLDPSMLLSSALENTNDIVNANMSASDSNNTCDMDKNSDVNLTNLDSVESYDPCNKLILGVKVGNKVHFFMPEANDNCDELLQKLCASRAREKEKENGIEDVRNLLSNDPSNHESLGSDNVNPPDSVSIQEKVQILADLEVKNDHSENCKSKSTEKSDFKSLLTDSDSSKGKTEHFEIVEHANSSEVKNIKMRISHRVIEEQRKSEIHDKNLQASVVSMHAEVNDQDRDSLEDSVQTFASVKDANSSGMKIIEMNVSQKRGNILDDCESLQSSEISNELNIEQCKDKILVNVSNRSSRFDEKTQSYVNDECMRSDKNSVKINKVLRVHNQRLNKSKIFNNELLLRAEDNGGQDSVDEFVECVKNNIDKQKDVVTGRKKWKCKSKETEYFHISSGNNVEFSARAQYSLDKVSPGDQYSIDESAESILNKRKDVENGKRKHRCKGKDSEYLCTSSSEENGEFIDAAKSFVAVHSSSVKVNHIQTAVSKNSKCRKILQKNGVNLNCKKRKIDNITSVESLCSPVGMDVVLVDENKYEEQKQSLDSSKNIQIGSEIVPVNIEKQLPKFYICKNTIRISHHPINEVESDTVKERPLNLLQICVNIKKSSEQIENIKENSTDIPMTESVVGELLHITESCFLSGIERKRQNSVDVQTVDETLDCTNLEKGSAIPQINTTKKTDYNFKNSLSIALNGTESHETPQDVLKTMSSEETLPKDNNAKVKLPVKSNILGEENLNNLNYSCDTFKKSMREIEKHIIVTNKISDKLLTLMSIVSDYGNKSLSTQQSQEGKTDNNTINSLTAKCIYPPSNTSNLIEKEDRMEKHEMLKKNYQICSENGVLQGIRMNMPITKWLELMQKTMEQYLQL